MEKNVNNWANIMKMEETPFNVSEWPTLAANSVVKTEPFEQEMFIKDEVIPVPEDSQFPSLANSRRQNWRKIFQLSQELSDDRPFETRYSNKVRKRLSKPSHLRSFMHKKTQKTVKNEELEKLMQKIKNSQFATFKGRKREIPKRRLTRLKKNILRIRGEKKREPTEIFAGGTDEPQEMVIESIENLKLETNVQEEEKLIQKNPFGPSQEIIQHSRQFRPYCSNLTSGLLCDLTEKFLTQLRIFQTKQHQKNPEKSKKRYVTGMSEVRKYLELKRVKLLIIAPDLEPNVGEGGIDETIEWMKVVCNEAGIPFLFSLKRRKIGYVLLKKVPVSCVGILSYDGCEEMCAELMEELGKQVARYKSGTILP